MVRLLPDGNDGTSNLQIKEQKKLKVIISQNPELKSDIIKTQ